MKISYDRHEKSFKPTKLTLTLESRADAAILWALCNLSDEEVRQEMRKDPMTQKYADAELISTQDLWGAVDIIMRNQPDD